MKKTYIIPFVNMELKFWEKLSSLYRQNIKEVYFPYLDNQIGTGRPEQPNVNLKEFLESKILPVSILINPVVLPNKVELLVNNVLKKLELYIKNYNLVGITLVNVDLAKKIKDTFPDLSITASTLMEIYNEQQLTMLNDAFDTIVPSNRILRDIRSLKNLKSAFRGKIRLLVNEACISSCIYRTQHFYEMSNPKIFFPRSLCNDLLEQKPWLRLTGGWVLPQHLYLFDDIYDEIKLAGRVSLQEPERYFEVLGSYINKTPLQAHQIGGGPASIGYPIEINTDFYKYTLYCEKNCESCSICEDYWAKNIN